MSKERFLPALSQCVLGHPLNAVKPLLQDVIRTRHEIRLFPPPKLVFRPSVGKPHIAPDRLALCSVRFAVERVYEVAIPQRSFPRFSQLLCRSVRNDFDIKGASRMVGNKSRNHVLIRADYPA